MDNFFEFLIVTGTIGLVMILITWQEKKTSTKDSKVLMRFNKSLAGLGLFLICFALFLPFYMIIHSDDSISGIVAMALIIILCFSFGYVIIRWSRFHRVLYNNDEIEVYDWKNRVKKFSWTQIKSIKLKSFKSKYVLLLMNGETVEIHQHLQGIDAFILQIRNRTRE